MKKAIKYCLFSIVVVTPLCLTLALAIDWKKSNIISCAGSSGIKPFIESQVDSFISYYKKNKNSKIDVTIDAGGSGFGINQVANGFVSIGNASKNPYHSIKDSVDYQTKWEKNNIKTLTFAWEGICILYVPPKGLSSNALTQLNSLFDINNENIDLLYSVFSGFYNSNVNLISQPKLGLFKSNAFNNLSKNDQELITNTNLIPYVRAGGSITSGTAASFYDGSHFLNAKEKLTDMQKKAFENGNYGNDFKLIDTDEANSRAWEIFIANMIPGSIIYLSSGFVENNMNLIKKYHIGIFTYNTQVYDINSVKDGFNFYRPLNIMFSIDNNNAYDLAEFLLNINNWTTIGAKPINLQDKESMMIDNNLRVSDVSIMKYENKFFTDDDVIFGAKDNYV